MSLCRPRRCNIEPTARPAWSDIDAAFVSPWCGDSRFPEGCEAEPGDATVRRDNDVLALSVFGILCALELKSGLTPTTVPVMDF
jgi:hypothetical protein